MMIWWNSMTGIEHFFALMAIAATLMLLIQTVLLVFGFEGNGPDDSLEVDQSALATSDEVELDHERAEIQDPGLRIFTVRGFVAFFSIFGWCGLACLQGGLSVPLSLLISFPAGLASMVAIALLLKLILSAQSDGSVRLANAVGKSGSVYMRVPAGRTQRGKVNVTVHGSYIEVDAVTDEDEDLFPGQQVTVIGMANPNTLLVVKKC